MGELELWQIAIIALIFCWSGFVRAGLGFGGALLSMPFILLVDNRPLIYLPIIAVHLLVFSSLTLATEQLKAKVKKPAGVNWRYLKKALAIMIVPKLVGVLGLITLPNYVMSVIIFSIVVVYAIGYIINKPFVSKSPWVDTLFLMLGAYISGTTLIGAPLIMAVFVQHVAKHQLRNTLFVLWFILVTIKMVAFVLAGVDLQWHQHLWLLPAAAVGHFCGLYAHNFLLTQTNARFYKVIGVVLLVASGVGLAKEFF